MLFRRISISPLGGLVLVAAVAHAAAGAIVFGVSWLDLPILANHHTGDGFWRLADDARLYYRMAADGATQGVGTIRGDVPSPLFIRAIAAWMRVFGVHPATPILFNLAVYIATCALIVRVARKDRAGAPGAGDLAIAAPVLALSWSPILFLSGTQILKDLVFACAIAVTMLAVRSLFRQIAPETSQAVAAPDAATAGRVGRGREASPAKGRPAARPALLRAIAPRLLWLWLGVAAIAGIRPYYAIFISAAIALAAGMFVVMSPRWRHPRIAGLGAAAVFAAWLGFVYGSGDYYTYYRDAAFSTVDAATGHVFSPLLPISATPVRAPGWVSDAPSVTANADTMRDGFALSGGGTNLARPAAGGPITSRWEKAWGMVRATTVGVAAMLVPISILRASGVVEIEGSRGFLWLTDVDTLFLDAMAIAVVWLLIRDRRALAHDRAYLCVCLVMFAMVTLMSGYVLTNLGMLVRLRVIAFVPLWMATLAISRPCAGSAAA